MISATVEYALRALVEFARLPAGETLLGRELAVRTGVAKGYLAKILGILRSAKILTASPGIGGGYGLAKPPEAITLIEIVQLIDGEDSLPKCLLHREHPCSNDNPCSAHELWGDVRERYLAFLGTTTVAEISQSASTEHLRVDAPPCAPPGKQQPK